MANKYFRFVVLKNYEGAMFFGDLPNRKRGKKGIWMGVGKDQIINLHEYFTAEELEASVALRLALTKQPNEEKAKLVILEKGMAEVPITGSASVDSSEVAALRNQLSSMSQMLEQMQQMMANGRTQQIYSEPPPQSSEQQSDAQAKLLQQILMHVKASSPKTLSGYKELNADEIAIKLMGEHASERTANFSDIGKTEHLETNATDVAKQLEDLDFDVPEEEV